MFKVIISAAIALCLVAAPALAHHPFGGQAPNSIVQGLVSGLGHPVLGADHFAFVVAMGLVAALLKRGFTLPLAFLLGALTGTGLHLQGGLLPVSEAVISGSVLLFGLLIVRARPLQGRWSTPALIVLTAVLGLFHGYAYGEAVIGSEPTPLVAYLLGLTSIQGAIAAVAYSVGRRLVSPSPAADQIAIEQLASADRAPIHPSGLNQLRTAGYILCGAGAAFLSNLLA